MMNTTLDQLEAFEQTLPAISPPLASYVTAVQTGNLVYTCGALPMKEGVIAYTGALGGFLITLEEGQQAARLCCMNLLSILKAHLGTLRRIEQVVKLTGYVNSRPGFTQQAMIINGASDLLVDVLGDAGRHARTSVGVVALPLDAAVEVDLIVQVRS